MKWNAIICSALIAASLLVTAACAVPITVFGEGKATAPADTAIITLSVESSQENRTAAQAEAAERMNEVINAVKGAGVADEEIAPGQSSGVSSFQSESRICRRVNNSTICENTTQTASSLQWSTTLRLKGTDQSRIDRVIDAARSAGAEAEVAGYGLDNSTKAANQARQNAVVNARENAEEMADAYGGRLGDLIEVSDYGYPVARTEDSENSAQAGMVEVVAYVVAIYDLKI
jgi:uncharacterized protein YggE